MYLYIFVPKINFSDQKYFFFKFDIVGGKNTAEPRLQEENTVLCGSGIKMLLYWATHHCNQND
jgi:hypothetical protein